VQRLVSECPQYEQIERALESTIGAHALLLSPADNKVKRAPYAHCTPMVQLAEGWRA
jgi:hypothetical protein